MFSPRPSVRRALAAARGERSTWLADAIWTGLMFVIAGAVLLAQC